MPTTNATFTTPLLLLIAALATCLAASIASAQDTLGLSPDITISTGGVVAQDEDVVVDNQLGIVLLENLGALPAAGDVVGHAVDANGDRLFTLANATQLAGGVFARAGDVVRYDGASYSIEFDASAEGVPMGVLTDAVAISPSGLTLSFDTTVSLDGNVYADEDLARWDGAIFSPAFDGSAAGVSGALDVDGAQDLGGGAFLLSFDTAGSVGGVAFSDEDVLRYDGASWSLEVDASTIDGDWLAADLDALVVPEPGLAVAVLAGLGGLATAAAGARRRRS